MRIFLAVALFGLVPVLASPQSTTYGTLTGVIRDSTGSILPGVSVTLFGAEVMGERALASEIDGRYLFRALNPGDYNLRFELSGFATLERRALVITAGRTITVDTVMELESVSETITVTGESPTVDAKTTALGGTFDVTALQEVPSATDMWAVLGQSPGIRMRGYDVGGSHKAQQSGYESYGIRGQNKVVSDGVDSTEGTGGAGFYYDYYSVDEFNVSAGGADVEMTSPGASVVMTVKGGGNELSGLYHLDYEDESFVGENSDAELEERGFTGNPNLLFWEAHLDLGGPIVRDRAWFFGAYNHFTLDKQRSGVDRDLATDKGIFDNYVAKLSIQLTESDRFIGYSQWGRKQAPTRGVSAVTPPESAFDQDGWTWVHKAEWQRVWSPRWFTNVQVKLFGFGFDFLPKVDPAGNPARLDTATGIFSGARATNPNTFNRHKPQVSAQASYYLPSKSGGHDIKFGVDWQDDGFDGGITGHPLPVAYNDNSRLGRPNNVNEIRVFNFPFEADFINRKIDAYAQDTWTVSDRLTVSLGVRFGSQGNFFNDAELDPVVTEVFPPQSVPGETVLNWFNAAPRLGASLDLTGRGKTILKGYYGRYYVNLGQTLSSSNPVIFAFKDYDFLDPNTNGLYDGPHELGALIRQTGGGATFINPDMTPSYSDEINLSLEHELAADTSARVSYVRKELKNVFGEFNRAQVAALEQRAVPCGDAVFPCPADPFTGDPLALVRLPESEFGAQDFAMDTFPGANYTYDTLQVAAQRRFRDGFFVQGNFDFQWRNEIRRASGESRSTQTADPVGVNTGGGDFFQNHNPSVPYLQSNTNWQAKLLARYVFPQEIATAANLRYQSGWPWAPIHRARFPGSGTQAFFLENIDNNRSEDVVLLDLRFDKSFRIQDRHRVTVMLDVYNVLNGNSETNFSLRTGRNFRNIIAALDPRTFKIGIRWQF